MTKENLLCRHGEQKWNGQAPGCGFNEDGSFREDNWNCFLLNAVRRLMNQHEENCPYGKCWWDDDQWQGVLYVPCGDNWWDEERSDYMGAVVLMTWYKSRGRTDSFKIVSGDTIREGTEQDAIEILKILKQYHTYMGKETSK